MEGMIKNFPDFHVFSGSDDFLLDILRAGSAGAITACNNICAALSAHVFNNWQNDDADALQQAVSDVRSVIQKFPLVAALKEVVAQATGEPGWRRQRPPLESLSNRMPPRLWSGWQQPASRWTAPPDANDQAPFCLMLTRPTPDKIRAIAPQTHRLSVSPRIR